MTEIIVTQEDIDWFDDGSPIDWPYTPVDMAVRRVYPDAKPIEIDGLVHTSQGEFKLPDDINEWDKQWAMNETSTPPRSFELEKLEVNMI